MTDLERLRQRNRVLQKQVDKLLEKNEYLERTLAEERMMHSEAARRRTWQAIQRAQYVEVN